MALSVTIKLATVRPQILNNEVQNETPVETKSDEYCALRLFQVPQVIQAAWIIELGSGNSGTTIQLPKLQVANE